MRRTESYRPLVAARAGGACEYCRLSEAATGVTFHVEHVVPRSQSGETAMSNLALSCPGCNLAKGDRTTGKDRNGKVQPLFSPRDFEPWLLGWHLHFVMNRETGLLVPRTAMAEATVDALNVNDTNRVFARKLQIQAGLIS
jgi:hypothetical protein